MRNLLTLSWWISLLGVPEISSMILDRTHYLIWSQAGYFLLKATYLAFATVLLFRFLSFRNRKTFETMVDSYNRISGQAWTPSRGGAGDRRKFLFCLGLVAVASTGFITPFAWGWTTFRVSILLDLAFWLMALHWVTRAHWLKSLGLREKLKEGLDDARSRLRSQAGLENPREAAVSRWPFLTLFFLALGITLSVGAFRWATADPVYRISDLKGCLQSCLERGLDRFHRDGRLEGGLTKEGCLNGHREQVDVTMGFQRGELLLTAIEKPGYDYFGNGKPGDQGLMLDADGRFRSTGK